MLCFWVGVVVFWGFGGFIGCGLLSRSWCFVALGGGCFAFACWVLGLLFLGFWLFFVGFVFR